MKGRYILQDTLPQPPRWTTAIFFFASGLEALLTVIYLLSIPTDPKNSVFLGYSTSRLILVAFMLAAALICLLLFFKTRRDPLKTQQLLLKWTQQKKLFLPLLMMSAFLFLCCWALSWTPAYRFGSFNLEFERLKPLIVWSTFVTAQLSLLLISYRFGLRYSSLKIALRSHPCQTRACLITLAILLFLWGLITLTGLGITPDRSFWNDNGIPVLALQSLLAWIAAFILLLVPAGRQTSKKSLTIDIILCVLLWFFAATLWVAQPQLPSFFAPEPAPPNDEYYPLSDAAEYDMNAQFALIGQGLYNGNHVDKPLYSTFLVLLHLLAGQDFDTIAALQAAFLAFLPVLLYLTGKNLHSRAAGLAAGILVTFKGLNAIASSWMILSVNPKLFLSEYPMGLGLALLTLLLVFWLKNRSRNIVYPLAIGGVFGLLALIRHNVWLMLPVIILLAGIQATWNWRKWLLSIILVCTSLFIAIGPWMWRSYQIWQDPWFFLIGLRTEVLENRYQVELQPQTTATPEKVIMTDSGKVSDLLELAYNPVLQNVWMGEYDNSSPGIHYEGNWLDKKDDLSFQQTLAYSTVADNQAVMNFTGERVKIVFTSHPANGKMKVYLDGDLAAVIDQYDRAEKARQTWESAKLPQGKHELVLVHSSGKMVNLDAIIIDSQPRQLMRSDDCPDIAYNWFDARHKVNLNHEAETYPLPFIFNLDGRLYTRIDFHQDGRLTFGRSLNDPELDESPGYLQPYAGEIDLSAGGEIYIDRFFESPTYVFIIEFRDVPLADGSGSINYEVILFEESGDILYQYKNIPAGGKAVMITDPEDSISASGSNIVEGNLNNELALLYTTDIVLCETTPIVLVEQGLYDDDEPAIDYDWSWRPSHQTGYGLNDSLHFSLSAGSEIRVHFSGNQLSLVYSVIPDCGKMKITLDGEETIIDQNSDTFKQMQIWESPKLPDGEHLLVMQHAGENGKYVGLDAVILGSDPQQYLEAAINAYESNTPAPTEPQVMEKDETVNADQAGEIDGGSSSSLWFIPSHFVHNMVTTFFVLPVSLVNDDLQHILQNSDGIWAQNWRGDMKVGALLLVLFNLLCIATGIGSAWSQWKIAGLVPLLTYLTYNLGTAAARTSGGRYIVPVDWILPVYFAIGIVQLSMWLGSICGLKTLQTTGLKMSSIGIISPPTPFKKQIILSILVVFAILLPAFSPLAADYLIPRQYEQLGKNELFYNLVADGSVEKMGFDEDQLAAFINDENSFIWQGRALYPRFYHADGGEPAKGPYRIMGFPRIIFTVVGPNTEKAGHAVLPTTIFPSNFPHNAEVTVIGCEDCDANVLAVIIPGEEESIYLRTPPTDLQCPFDEPQCDGDNCQ